MQAFPRLLPTLATCLSGFLTISSVHAQAASPPAPVSDAEIRASNTVKGKPNPALDPIADDPALPRILLIGDSISIGYTLPVRKLLEGKANVHRIPRNGGPTKNGLANIDAWLGSGKWDIIHFNWGLHDLKHMPDGKRQVEIADYEANLRTLVARMKQTGAVLIWATTTPVPEGDLNPPRSFGDVKIYNDIAATIMQENDVLIDDLNAAVTPGLATLQNPKDVHFNPAGSQFLAEKVAACIEAQLPKKAIP